MGDDLLNDVPAEGDDRIAAKAASFDDALAEGRDPLTALPDDNPEELNALLAAQASLQMLERVWPRADKESLRDPNSAATGVDGPEPASFGRFRIIRELGRGGFGVVFLAFDPDLGRHIALKIPHAEVLLDPQSRRRFIRESRAAASLDHPNLVPLYEAGEVGPVCYLVSAYCEGPTLAAWLRDRRDPIPPLLAARILAPLADAMRHAHERGVLHCDLKPSNILLHRPGTDTTETDTEAAPVSEPVPAVDGGTAREDPAFVARIVDFGLARLMDRPGAEVTVSLAPMGSAPFMAPEQVEGKKLCTATDIYGLGAILYAMLFKRPPHVGVNNADTLHRVVSEEPIAPRQLRRAIPRDLEAICLKCLEKDPARRYCSAGDLVDDIHRFLAAEPTKARPVSLQARAWRAVCRRPARFAVVALVVGVVLASVAGARWYEGRLETASRFAQVRDAEFRRRDVENRRLEAEKQRHLQYVKDIREADKLIRLARASSAMELLMRHRPSQGEEDLREFAWYLLLRRCHTELHTLTVHVGDVYFVEFSSRGDLLASAGKDGVVRIWDTTTWQLARSWVASRTEVNVASFSRDGKTVATVDDDGYLQLWETATGKREFRKLVHTGDAVVARFTPDGKTIVTGGKNDGFVKLWERDSGILTGTYEHGANCENAIFSPDMSILATVGANKVKLWSSARRSLLHSFKADGIRGAAFSNDGTNLAIASGKGRAQLWNVSDGRPLGEWQPNVGALFSVAFTPDDRTLISTGDDGVIRFWESISHKQLGMHMGHIGRIWNLALSPDGHILVSAGRDGTVKCWDAEPPRDYLKLSVPDLCRIGFAAEDGSLLTLEVSFSGSYSVPHWIVSRWDVDSGAVPTRQSLGPAVNYIGMQFSNDGRLLAVATKGGAITIWDPVTGQRQFELDQRSDLLDLIEFSPDNQLLLVHDVPSKKFMLWEIMSRTKIPFPWDELDGAIFTPSSEIIAILHTGFPGLWNPRTGRAKPLTSGQTRVIHRLTGPLYGQSFTVSPDGRILAAVDVGRGKTQLRSADTLELRNEWSGYPNHHGGITFSPDGKTLATAAAEGVVKLWETATGEELLTLDGYPDPVWILRFSPDGRALAAFNLGDSVSVRGISLWRTAAREKVIVSDVGHSMPTSSVKISPPGDR